MGRPYQILLPLFSLFLQRVDITDVFPLRFEVKVLKIYDGDTILVRYHRQKLKVRLSKLDAPESGQPFLNGKGDAGKVAKNCLENILPVGSLTELRIEKQDIYGRLLGDVGEVSLKLIQAGCSTLYPHAQFHSQKEKMFFLRELQLAKKMKRGLWAGSGIRRPKDWRKISKRNAHQRWRR